MNQLNAIQTSGTSTAPTETSTPNIVGPADTVSGSANDTSTRPLSLSDSWSPSDEPARTTNDRRSPKRASVKPSKKVGNVTRNLPSVESVEVIAEEPTSMTATDQPSDALVPQEVVSLPTAWENMHGKPVLYRDVKTVLTIGSEQFQEKLLCDGLVLNLGDACVFNCAFCYVPAAMTKLDKCIIDAHNAVTGQCLGFGDVVIRRRNSLEVLKSQLVNVDGTPVYPDPDDNRVVFSSTLVDVAANMELLRETAAACLLILQHTHWQIRLLSKSSLLKLLIEREMIPKEYHHRFILGFSIGTLDDKVAAAIELNTGLVSTRIKALHWLQDHGIRTFGMICPSLAQDDYAKFSRDICAAIRVDRCEHIWAEVINVRGQSLTKTLDALRGAGLDAEASRLEAVSGPKSKGAWEQYARSTFLAHKVNIPADKLRFLQYVKPETTGWWKEQIPNGAVLLGKGATEVGLTSPPKPAAPADQSVTITITGSTPSEMLPSLDQDDVRYREEREDIVTIGLKVSIAASKALYEIYKYRDGILWKADFRSFHLYFQAKWGYQKSQGYLLVETGEFIAEWAASHSAKAENLPINAGHVRPLLAIVPKVHRVECWSKIVAGTPAADLTGKIVSAEAEKFLTAKGLASKQSKPVKADDNNRRAKEDLDRLRLTLAKLPCPVRFKQLLEGIMILIDQDPDGTVVDIEAAEVLHGDSFHQDDPAPTAPDGHADVGVPLAPKRQLGIITAELVAEALVDVSPSDERGMVATAAERAEATSVGRHRSSVATKQDRIAPATPMGKVVETNFMSAALFHAVLCPGEDFAAWLAATSARHPADIRILDNGGGARITLIRAKCLAFNDRGAHGTSTLKLATDAENSGSSNPGAFADALFAERTLAAETRSHTEDASLTA